MFYSHYIQEINVSKPCLSWRFSFFDMANFFNFTFHRYQKAKTQSHCFCCWTQFILRIFPNPALSHSFQTWRSVLTCRPCLWKSVDFGHFCWSYQMFVSLCSRMASVWHFFLRYFKRVVLKLQAKIKLLIKLKT